MSFRRILSPILNCLTEIKHFLLVAFNTLILSVFHKRGRILNISKLYWFLNMAFEITNNAGTYEISQSGPVLLAY